MLLTLCVVATHCQVNDVVQQQGFKYHTFVEAGFYFSNFTRFTLPYVDASGTVVSPLALRPTDILYGYDTGDTGEPSIVGLLIQCYFVLDDSL